MPSPGDIQYTGAQRNKEDIMDFFASYFADKSRPLEALEIASGDGTHVACLAEAFTHVTWTPSEADEAIFDALRYGLSTIEVQRYKKSPKPPKRSSQFVEAFDICPYLILNIHSSHIEEIRSLRLMWILLYYRSRVNDLANVKPMLELKIDTGCDLPNHRNAFDIIFNANMIQIAEFSCKEALFALVAKTLKTGSGSRMFLYGSFADEGGAIAAESNRKFQAFLKALNPNFGLREVGAVVAVAEKNGLVLEADRDMPANNKMLVFKRA